MHVVAWHEVTCERPTVNWPVTEFIHTACICSSAFLTTLLRFIGGDGDARLNAGLPISTDGSKHNGDEERSVIELPQRPTEFLAGSNLINSSAGLPFNYHRTVTNSQCNQSCKKERSITLPAK
jgi:hypothetical protein